MQHQHLYLPAVDYVLVSPQGDNIYIATLNERCKMMPVDIENEVR